MLSMPQVFEQSLFLFLLRKYVPKKPFVLKRPFFKARSHIPHEGISIIWMHWNFTRGRRIEWGGKQSLLNFEPSFISFFKKRFFIFCGSLLPFGDFRLEKGFSPPRASFPLMSLSKLSGKKQVRLARRFNTL